jgi:succinyl-CoA synthetase alpha subunit
VAAFVLVRKDSYHDSVLLMRISEALKHLAGVGDAVVAMATPQNRELLEAQGYRGPEFAAAGPNDLVIAVKGDAGAAKTVEAALDELLRSERRDVADEVLPATLAAALKAHPEANLVLISLPGEHAAREARRALALGMHVMVFSDNVAIEDEVALKREAVARGLLLMGPDCGTAIINGKPLGFANAVRRGPIGVVGAAGTGLQEVTSCIHRLGGGVSQAIGTGGRDLSERVGGAMTMFAIEALAADPETQVVAVVSKTPSPGVAKKVLGALGRTPKPCVVHFVGDEPREADAARGIVFADSLAGAAELACRLAGVAGCEGASPLPDEAVVARLAGRLRPGVKLRGLFCGGTTGQEALALLTRAGLEIRSNLHKKGELRMDGTKPVAGHAVLDLGDDVFTRGRPHPMIEPVLRNERLAVEMADADVGVLLFDVVLGYGAHPDPAGVLVAGVEQARATTGKRRREIVAIASVTGTLDDPQDSRAQAQKLAAAGIVVAPDNRQAAALAAAVLRRAG